MSSGVGAIFGARYAGWLARRTFVAQVGLFALAFVLGAATDEGNLSFAVRMGRAVPLAPVTAAVATYAVIRGARNRGEERALASLGLSKVALGLVAALAAMLCPLVLAAGILLGRVDVSGFYPEPPSAPSFVDRGETFDSGDLGISVAKDGSITGKRAEALPPPKPPASLPESARGAAALSTVVVALALSLAAGRAEKMPRSVVPSVAVAAATLVGFQLAAAGQMPAFAVIVPALGLLLVEALAYRRAR